MSAPEYTLVIDPTYAVWRRDFAGAADMVAQAGAVVELRDAETGERMLFVDEERARGFLMHPSLPAMNLFFLYEKLWRIGAERGWLP